MDILAWLRELGLERYERAFRENEIAADILPKLTADDLKDIGVAIVGHRRKLLEAIAALAAPALTPKTGPGAPAEAPPTARLAEGERRQLTVMFVDLVGSTALFGFSRIHFADDGFPLSLGMDVDLKNTLEEMSITFSEQITVLAYHLDFDGYRFLKSYGPPSIIWATDSSIFNGTPTPRL